MIPLNPWPQFIVQTAEQVNGDGSLIRNFYFMLLSFFKRTGGASGIPFTVGQKIEAIGTGQSTATVLSDDYNEVLTGGGGVVLFSLQPGQTQAVFNGTGGNLHVYPILGGQIDALAANAPYVLANGKTQYFTAYETLASGQSLLRSLQLG